MCSNFAAKIQKNFNFGAKIQMYQKSKARSKLNFGTKNGLLEKCKLNFLKNF